MAKSSRKLLFFLPVVVFLGFAAGVIFSGLLFPWRPLPTSSSVERVAQATDLDQYLRDREARFAKVKPDLASGIVWLDPVKKDKTPLSVIYLHGFSASRGETAPLMDNVAHDIGANLYYPRLNCHGMDDGGESCADVTAQDWLDDSREALAIGRRIGEKVVIVGMSTGAPLAIELAFENEQAKDLAALVLISPNHSPRAFGAQIVSGPLGAQLAHLLIGKYRSFPPSNAAHGYFWTTRYRSEAVVAMMDLVNYVRGLDFSEIKIPVLTLYTHNDKVVDVPLIVSRHKEFGSSLKEIIDLPQATRHEMASQALAPEVVKPASDVIEDFIKKATVSRP
jgi:alpha-beta hydrolase superfamily lysophospholipase